MQKYTRRTALTALCALLLTACPSSTQPGGSQPTVTRQKPQAVVAIALGGGASKSSNNTTSPSKSLPAPARAR